MCVWILANQNIWVCVHAWYHRLIIRIYTVYTCIVFIYRVNMQIRYVASQRETIWDMIDGS